MKKTFEIEGLKCTCASVSNNRRIVYILYPMDMLADWIEPAAEKYDISIVVVTGMDWQNVFSPWAAKGVPKGTADFKGESPEFLRLLQRNLIPQIESGLGMRDVPQRTLVGVSMSGLFALWQWMKCDTFLNIASLSGSFWFEGFVEWMKSISIPEKAGKGFFLLGDTESKAKSFGTVEVNTMEIISLLRKSDIEIEFQSVPGNHYANPLDRLNKAFEALFSTSKPNHDL